MNSVIFIGHITSAPKINPSGITFTLAVDREGGGTDYFRCTVITARKLTKGMRILFTGRAENNNHISRDGAKVYNFQYVADHIEILQEGE